MENHSTGTGILSRLGSIPFTITMLALLIILALLTRTHLGPLSKSILHNIGFRPLHLPRMEWQRLFTSAFLTVGGWSFYASIIMFAIGVGSAESLLGTKRTILLFWGVHLLTLLLQSLVVAIPLHRMDVWWGTLLAKDFDVGPSAGYYGCLGASCSQLSGSGGKWVIGSILFYLIIRLVLSIMQTHSEGSIKFGADMAHLIAFPLGILFVQILSKPA